MKDVQSGICEEESVDVDARAIHTSGRIPSFVDRCALEYTGNHASCGRNNHEDHACPDKPSVVSLNSESKVKVEDRNLCDCYANVIYKLAEVVQLSLESALYFFCRMYPMRLTSSDTRKLVLRGRS